jgi:hypothetical protein
MKSKVDLFVMCFAIVVLVMSCASFKNNTDSETVTTVVKSACEITCSQQVEMDQESCYKLCDMTDDITDMIEKNYDIRVEQR